MLFQQNPSPLEGAQKLIYLSSLPPSKPSRCSPLVLNAHLTFQGSVLEANPLERACADCTSGHETTYPWRGAFTSGSSKSWFFPDAALIFSELLIKPMVLILFSVEQTNYKSLLLVSELLSCH